MAAGRAISRDFPWRRRLLLAVFALGAVGLLARAVHLQMLERDFLQSEGRNRHLRVMEVAAQRGRILDRHGEALAMSTPVDSVWAEPDKLLSQPDRIGHLAGLLELDPQGLVQRLQARRDREFLYLRRHLEPSKARRVAALKLAGVGLQREYRRYYPTGEVLSHLVGYTDIDERGLEGLELAYDEWLRPRPGAKRVVRDRHGAIVDQMGVLRMPRDGRDLQLSLDRRLQYLSYRALKRAVLRHRARGGTLLVLDPSSGEILAMASQPAGNPNDVAARKPALQRNRAVVDLFEPGSTLKPFTVAAALESGRFAPDTRIQTSPGYLRLGGQTVRDVRDFGELDVAGILRKSSNVGVSKIALALPAENLWRLYAGLGFGAEAGLGFPGEQGAQLSHFSNWSRFERAAHSYGYGLAVSTLHLAQAYGVLAADGMLRKPVLIAPERPAAGERILSAATARQIRRMLMAVVGPEGTARAAAVPGYQVGGKTGTVRKHGSGGYQEDRYLALFVGFAPVERPRFVVAVVLDDPRGEVYYGGQVAAPVFAEVMRGALRLFGVPPDQPPPAATRLLVAHGEGSDGR